MKVKDKSFWGKVIIVAVSYALCVLKWTNVLPNASVTEIWGAGATAYGILLGTIDFNITADSLKGR